MTNLFQFGESHPDYAVRVLNEREARGGAGILFLLALTGFLQVWFKGDFAMTAVVIVGFLSTSLCACSSIHATRLAWCWLGFLYAIKRLNM